MVACPLACVSLVCRASGSRAGVVSMSVYALQNVCVVGLGYVGLPTAAIIASAGHRVTGVDISKRTIDTLSQGRSTIDEPGVKELVEHALVSGALSASSTPVPADIFLI